MLAICCVDLDMEGVLVWRLDDDTDTNTETTIPNTAFFEPRFFCN